jgi:hypothetical protein
MKQAMHVDVKHLVPVVHRIVPQLGVGPSDACAVDQNIHLAKGRLGRGHCPQVMQHRMLNAGTLAGPLPLRLCAVVCQRLLAEKERVDDVAVQGAGVCHRLSKLWRPAQRKAALRLLLLDVDAVIGNVGARNLADVAYALAGCDAQINNGPKQWAGFVAHGLELFKGDASGASGLRQSFHADNRVGVDDLLIQRMIEDQLQHGNAAVRNRWPVLQ